jgi:hypothetical protein
MAVSFKQEVVTKLLSYIQQHKDDLGPTDYSEMTEFLMSQFSKEMQLFKVTYAKLKIADGKVRHVRKNKLVCSIDNLQDIVIPVENEFMHGIRFVDSDDGRTSVQFEDCDDAKLKRTLIHMQRVNTRT